MHAVGSGRFIHQRVNVLVLSNDLALTGLGMGQNSGASCNHET